MSTPAMDAYGNIYVCSGSRLYAIGSGPGVNDDQGSSSNEALVLQICPNPFRGNTEISVSQGNMAESAELKIYDISGRMVRSIPMPATCSSGAAVVSWNGRDDHGGEVESGVYFCRLQAGGFCATGKMIVLE